MAQGFADYSATRIETIGAETAYGPHAKVVGIREVILRLAVRHADKRALDIFAKEFAAPGTSFAPGTTGGGSGRPDVAPSIKQFAFLIDKTRLSPTVVLAGIHAAIAVPPGQADLAKATPPASSDPVMDLSDSVEVPLIRIAHGRSGDKGDISNIGIIARTPALLPLIKQQVTAVAVKTYLGYAVEGDVTRYDLPGLDAVNFAAAGVGTCCSRTRARGCIERPATCSSYRCC